MFDDNGTKGGDDAKKDNDKDTAGKNGKDGNSA